MISVCNFSKSKLFFKSCCPVSSCLRQFSMAERGMEQIAKVRTLQIAELLGCTTSAAFLLICRRQTILNIKLQHLESNATFCKKHLKLHEILDYPGVITLRPGILEQRFLVLQEIGCTNITAGRLVRFNHLMRKTPYQLRKHGLLPSTVDPIASMISVIDCPEEINKQIREKLPHLYLLTCSVLNIKMVFHIEYLSWLLQFPVEEIAEMLNKYPSLGTKSVSSFEKNFWLLTEHFGFAITEIRKNPFMLASRSENIEDILLKIPIIAGEDVKHLVKKCPRILSAPVSTLERNLEVLKEFEVTDEQILSCLFVLTLCPETIRQRLKDLYKNADFEILKTYDRMLWLVYGHKKAKQKLEEMKSCNFASSSLSLLCTSEEQFDNPLLLGKSRTYGKNSCLYLACLFGCSKEVIKKKLQEHPDMYRSSLLNTKKVVEFLFNNGITKDQLWNGLIIVLYDISIVIEYFKKLSHQEEFQLYSEWIGHFNVVQLLIYFIERDANFSGGGIFKRKANHDLMELQDEGNDSSQTINEFGYEDISEL